MSYYLCVEKCTRASAFANKRSDQRFHCRMGFMLLRRVKKKMPKNAKEVHSIGGYLHLPLVIARNYHQFLSKRFGASSCQTAEPHAIGEKCKFNIFALNGFGYKRN